ncbi:uncharacterized protein LOC126551923 [Aphis gossypii]|uniref:uncharacterized protein LOC126551923 n=1 Tax=Aphis gossypii TaxID=80765 RepID=UPI00215996CA|nr:uncharacterized protein LOC126551923 [Aphis gossypii]
MIEKEQQCEAFIESKKCLDFILNEVEKDMDKSFICDVLHLQNSNIIFNSGYNFPLNCNENEYFFKNIMVNTNKITQIFNETKAQSESNLWVKIRNDRISASLKAHKIKSCKDLSIQNQNKLAISLLTNKNLGYQGKINVAYGKQFENIALDFYSKSFNTSVIKCGVIIHSKNTWLCASPDGIVVEHGKLVKVLEVKCPISCKDKPIFNSVNNTLNVSYLKYEKNQICLKKNHQYYTQCQILMYCSGLDKCDFLVYNKIDPIIITIDKNDMFLKKILIRLEYFYFNFYLQKLIKS